MCVPYLSFCLWMRWRRRLCCPDWPRPVCDARLWLALWLEACLWRWRRGRGSVVCLESSAASRAAAEHLETESEQVVGFVSAAAEIVTRGSTAHLSFHWRPPGGAVCAVPVSSPPAAAGRPSPWWATWIWVRCVTPHPQSCSCSNDIKHVSKL